MEAVLNKLNEAFVANSHKTGLRFLLSGASTTCVYFILSYLLIRAGWRPFSANIASYAIAFLFGYLLQRTWTFRGRHPHREALPRYLAAQLGCALTVAVAADLAMSSLHPSPFLLSLGAASSSAGISYVVSVLWVFPAQSTKSRVSLLAAVRKLTAFRRIQRIGRTRT